MRRQILAILAVGLMLSLSGCAFASWVDDDGVTETPTETPGAYEVEGADLTEDTVGGDHWVRLNSFESYTVHRNESIRATNRSLVRNATYQVDRANGTYLVTRRQVQTRNGTQQVIQELLAADSQRGGAVRRTNVVTQEGDQPAYESVGEVGTVIESLVEEAQMRSLFIVLVNSNDWRTVEETTIGGQPVTVYEATNVTNPQSLRPAAKYGDVGSANIRLYISGGGVIYRMQYTADVRLPNEESAAYTLETKTTQIGETVVTSPDWFSKR